MASYTTMITLITTITMINLITTITMITLVTTITHLLPVAGHLDVPLGGAYGEGVRGWEGAGRAGGCSWGGRARRLGKRG